MKHLFILILFLSMPARVFSQDSLQKKDDSYTPVLLNLDAALNVIHAAGGMI